MNDLMTRDEQIVYLRLDADRAGRPMDKLRSLSRRHGLPRVKRGRLQLFSRSAVDAWLSSTDRTVKTA